MIGAAARTSDYRVGLELAQPLAWALEPFRIAPRVCWRTTIGACGLRLAVQLVAGVFRQVHDEILSLRDKVVNIAAIVRLSKFGGAAVFQKA